VQVEPYPATLDQYPDVSRLRSVPEYMTWHDARAGQYPTRNAYQVRADSDTTVLPLSLSAGSVLLMSAQLRHCSQGNRSRRTRRAYMPQYSAGVVSTEHDALPLALAVPVGMSHV
jgi:ectoine hydroxylase-related dioxygenase (phytanoyl-CoA dioxygenase family)